jgi:2-octaprenyl-6-methoxyphenol hydroxylase
MTAPRHDIRASTLAASSVVLLKKLGLYDALSAHMQPVEDMMIGEGCVGDISPLSLHFDGAQRSSAMAYMIENEVLRRACVSAVMNADNVTVINGQAVTDYDATERAASVTLTSGQTFSAPLLIAADGRNSALRKMAEIPVDTHAYDQKAIVLGVSHTIPHDGVAHQLFLSGGPFAILPMTENRACIVWSDKTRAVDAALALPAPAFKAELMRRMGGVLGEVTLLSDPQSYPLTLQMAEQYTKGRVALVGDAAHVILPLAGQGLNMGLRDVAALIDCLTDARKAGLDIGGAELIQYGRWRRFDNTSLATMTDALNLLFSNPIAPLRHLRRLGLASIDKAPAMRAFFMSEAAGETGELPSLLRA